jgi:hypothetical protein
VAWGWVKINQVAICYSSPDRSLNYASFSTRSFSKNLETKKIESCTDKSICEGPVIEWKFNMGSFNPWKEADLAGKTDCMTFIFLFMFINYSGKMG